MTGYTRQVYLLSPKELSPETIAVTFAKTSRSAESFREIAAELTESKSAEFNEKWVVGYGHSSVAEHAVLHIAIENVSRLAVETIQSTRLASFTEKSTRYQKWSPDAYYLPREILNSEFEKTYNATTQMLFDVYQRSLPACRAVLALDCPRAKEESDQSYERRLRSVYVDSCRFLLPASSLANLGMTANARVLEHLISKMLSHPLEEVKQIGEEIKNVARNEVPTLVKYANRQDYLCETPEELTVAASNMPGAAAQGDWCQLVDFTKDGDDRVLAAALYRYGQLDYGSALAQVQGMDSSARIKLANVVLGKLGKFDWPLRELEHISYTFDIAMDQGAYYEVKRHRMMTQTPQQLTCDLGWVMPRLIEQAGFSDDYRQAMDASADAYRTLLRVHPEVASYIVPNGFLRRSLLTMNLREAFSFIQLRSAPNAHFSVRRVAQRMAEQIRQVHPILGAHLRVDENETWQQVEQQYFCQ